MVGNRYRQEIECDNKEKRLPLLEVEISNTSKKLEELREGIKGSGAIPTNGGVEVAGIKNLRNRKANNLRTSISDLETKLTDLNEEKSELNGINCERKESGMFNFLDKPAASPAAATAARKSLKSRKSRKSRKGRKASKTNTRKH